MRFRGTVGLLLVGSGSGGGGSTGLFALVRWSRRSCGGAVQAEHGQPGEVDRCGEQPKVGVDAGGAADSGAAPAVAAAHQVGELAFDLGAGGAVVAHPGRVGLAGAGVGQGLLVRANRYRAPTGGGGALRAQRASGAGRREMGGSAAVAGPGGSGR